MAVNAQQLRLSASVAIISVWALYARLDHVLTCSSLRLQVVMQFGKVCPDTYILDYNPTITTALQAFSIALSTFDGKLRF